MTVYRVNEDKDVYLLVKVKRVYAEHDGADHTARRVRKVVREDVFGGEDATVRRLTAAEVKLLAANPTIDGGAS